MEMIGCEHNAASTRTLSCIYTTNTVIIQSSIRSQNCIVCSVISNNIQLLDQTIRSLLPLSTSILNTWHQSLMSSRLFGMIGIICLIVSHITSEKCSLAASTLSLLLFHDPLMEHNSLTCTMVNIRSMSTR
jgi:hypothetical protein